MKNKRRWICPRFRAGAVRPFAFFFLFAILASCCAGEARANCEQVPAGRSFWIRLADPVASYSSKKGTTVRAVLIQSPDCDGGAVFPAGLEVNGQVTDVRKVGLGFRHDTAYLQIVFDRMTTSDGAVLPIAAQVVEIDNAREAVRNGKIRGVRATNTPQGRITSGLIHLPTYDPYGDLGLIVYRMFTVLPEPEIYLPPGTDLRLQLTAPLPVSNQPALPRASFQMDEYMRGDVESILQRNSARTFTSKGKAADVVNVLFLGSQDEVDSAFRAAGWVSADHNSTHTVLRQFRAFLTLSNYPTAPVSTQYLDGRAQNLTWQKSFNAYGKREHLRLWEQAGTVSGQEAWLGAYTRETSAVLSVNNRRFIHHVDRNLDDGVNMLVRDLTLAGCVKSVRLLPRPDLNDTVINATGDEMHTDGDLTVVQLSSCDQPGLEYSHANPLIPYRPRSRFARYLRTQVLVYKSDVIRGNIIYSAFDLTRMGIHALRFRHRKAQDDDSEDGLPLSPVSPDTLFPQLAMAEDSGLQ